MGEGCCFATCCPGALLGLRIKLRVQENIQVGSLSLNLCFVHGTNNRQGERPNSNDVYIGEHRHLVKWSSKGFRGRSLDGTKTTLYSKSKWKIMSPSTDKRTYIIVHDTNKIIMAKG